MDRRKFLALLLATAAIDPEKLLWVPGKKAVFIPKRCESTLYFPCDCFKIGDTVTFGAISKQQYVVSGMVQSAIQVTPLNERFTSEIFRQYVNRPPLGNGVGFDWYSV